MTKQVDNANIKDHFRKGKDMVDNANAGDEGELDEVFRPFHKYSISIAFEQEILKAQEKLLAWSRRREVAARVDEIKNILSLKYKSPYMDNYEIILAIHLERKLEQLESERDDERG